MKTNILVKWRNNLLKKTGIQITGKQDIAKPDVLAGTTQRRQMFLWLALGVVFLLLLLSSLADGTDGVQKYLQLLIGGVSLGSIYALLALAFVIVYKATSIFNLAQGVFVLLGAYMGYQFAEDWGLPFFAAMAAAILFMALVGGLVERAVIRPMVGKPVFSTVLVTLGILIVGNEVITSAWSQPAVILSAPWESDVSKIGGVSIRHGDIWTVGIVVILLALFFVLFRYTRVGLGMRATAIDQEAAASQGIRVGTSFSVSWMIAAVLGTVAGVMLVSRQGGALTPALGFVTFRAFPAMIVGGLDSTGGAVAGGLLIGLAEVMSQGYVDLDFLGSSFETVVPYVAMIVVMLWRPQGLFGTKSVARI